MAGHRLKRRTFLKAAGGLTVALPLLSALRAEAGASAFPKRLVLMYNPNGTIPDAWWPTNVASETEFDLNEIHAPLAPFKDRLLILQGLDLKVTSVGPGGPHQRGIGSLFTGRELQQGEFADGCGSLAGWANGISVDQEVANHIGLDTPLSSLELAARALEADVQSRISYSAAGRPLPPINDPRETYTRLFSGFQTDPNTMDRLRAERRSVLDAVQGQLSVINKRAGSEDRVKLEHHQELVRDLERRLDATNNGAEGCYKPDEPPILGVDDENDMPEITRLQFDLLALAFACDLTRVASVQLSTGYNRIRFPWLNSLGEGHALSHAGPSDMSARVQMVDRWKWHAQMLANFMVRLAAIKEGDGSALDNTLIVWCSEVSQGNTHSLTNMPFLLAGNVNGYFKTGRYLEFNDLSHQKLLVSILNAYGIDTETFGHPDFVDGPLSGLT